jgi:hypothetical protein
VLEQKHENYDPIIAFMYALKAPESRRQYPRRFKPFLDFLKLEGSLSEMAKQFWLKAKENSRWAEVNLMQFIQAQLKGRLLMEHLKTLYRQSESFYQKRK